MDLCTDLNLWLESNLHVQITIKWIIVWSTLPKHFDLCRKLSCPNKNYLMLSEIASDCLTFISIWALYNTSCPYSLCWRINSTLKSSIPDSHSWSQFTWKMEISAPASKWSQVLRKNWKESCHHFASDGMKIMPLQWTWWHRGIDSIVLEDFNIFCLKSGF